MTANELIASLKDNTPLRVAMPVRSSQDRKRFTGVFRSGQAPNFQVLFPAGSLDENEIDRNRKVEITVHHGGEMHLLLADIRSLESRQAVNLVGRELLTPDQLREYFRVDVSTPVVASSILPPELAVDDETWRLQGETIDVSAGGILASFPEPVEGDEPIRLDLILPTADAHVVHTVARVVRSRKVSDREYQVAFQFDKIEPADQDRIMACCFEIQRKHLRLKVQVKQP